ncbi:hypothetical protein FNL56_19975 [Tardiphaga sp. vice304]|uniref:hypothetical protein n=1 Tax=Tardiphaga sp. vice304 TaxID=2592817 RepID=UPI00116415C3|nr:hypothetical protein [Tardiphaga sp. vice304]QDM28150.1 hypothetical protein FNL56_19975 [Tardiphaga sp. vice304]
MATDQQLKANRLNSKASTGPKSLRGKSASKRNAVKHGLSINIATHPHIDERVNALAKLLLPNGSSKYKPQAIEAAIAQLEILRIREYRAMLSKDLSLGEGDSSAVKIELPSNEILDRYERRAFSRRARALRQLVSASGVAEA